MAEFDQIFANDPNNPQNVAENGVISIYAPGTRNHIPLKTVTGGPLANPLQLNSRGFGPAFIADGYTLVAWEAVAPGEVFQGTFKSYKGILAETIEARTAAQTAATTAGTAAVAVVEEKLAAGEFNGTPGLPGRDGSNVLPTDQAIVSALTTPGAPANTALSATVAGDVSDPSSDSSAFFRAEYGVSIAAYGAVGDGVVDDTAAIQVALNASSRVFIPEPAVAYRVTGRLIPKAGQTIRGIGKRSVIRQDTWGEPVFDGIDRPDLTIEELHCLSTRPRTWGTVGARGDSSQAIGAAVWSNADRLTTRNVWVTGLYCGVTLSSWNGTNLTSRKQVGVRIDGLTVDAVDFGILAKGQLNFRANNVCGSFTFASPSTATQPPYPHLIYFSSEGYESEDVIVTNSSATNGSTSTDAYAFQFKGVNGGGASNLSATNCHGLLALFGVKDMGFNQLVSINDLSDGQGSIYLGDANNARNTFSDIVIRMGVDRRAVRVDGSDNKFTGLNLHVSHATAVGGSADIQVYGTRNTIESPKIINTGAGCWSGVIIESGEGHQVRNPYLSKVFRGTMVSNATNAVVEYDPAMISAGTGAGANYRPFFTTGTTALVSRPARVAKSTGNGGVVQPEAGSHGVLEYTTTGTSGITVGNPRSEARALGLTLTVTIINGSAGAAGTVTWQADYMFRGSAPASPAAGARISVTFAWDGTAWQEVSRSV